MKNMILKSKRGVLAITMSLLVVAMYAPDASAQGRASSKSGTKQRVEKRSEKKQSTKTPAKKSERASSKATTGRSNKSSGRSTATTRKNSSGSSNANRSGSRQATRGSSSGTSQKRVAVERDRAPKPVQDVRRRGDDKSQDSKTGRGSVRDPKSGRASNSDGRGSSRAGNQDSKSGKSGVRGTTGGRSSRDEVSNGSGRGSSRAGNQDSDSGKSGVRGTAEGRSGRDRASNGRTLGNDDNRQGNRGSRGVREGNRGRYNGPVLSNRNKVKTYRHRNNHKWQHQYFRPDRVHVNVYPRNWHRHIHVSSHVHVGVAWPWQYRYRRHWEPRYRYRQVVYVNVGWGRNQRQSRIDVRTYYKQRVRHANSEYAEIEIDIDSIELYENGRFIGYVDRIPNKLREINATVYANGRVEFDRNVFLIGDIYRGFEMISSRYYDDYLLNSYDRRDGVRVGRLDLRKERVKSVRRSRLFNSHKFNGNVPVSLLPEDDRLFDYSYELFSGNDGYGRDRYNSDFLGQNGFAPNGYETLSDYESGLERIDDVSYSTSQGALVEMKRESSLQRIE